MSELGSRAEALLLTQQHRTREAVCGWAGSLYPETLFLLRWVVGQGIGVSPVILDVSQYLGSHAATGVRS